MNEDIKVIRVPCFEELSARIIQEQVLRLPKFLTYLPDILTSARTLNRDYLFNVSSYTLTLVDHQHN